MTAVVPGGRASGILGVIKPPGMTSHEVVRVARAALGTPRVGHLGTLDPPAAGVLPLALGSATRLSALMLELPKSYRAEFLFGVESDTGDLSGKVTAVPNPPGLDPVDLDRAIVSLTGRHCQKPPAYSARKVRGIRLYELARRGKVGSGYLDARAKEIEVYRSAAIAFGVRRREPFAGYPFAVIDLSCSSGTYVRQLAAMTAEQLGTSGCVSFLLRTRSCGFDLRDCLTVEELLVAPGPVAPAALRPRGLTAGWRPAAEALAFLQGLVLPPDAVQRVIHGAPVRREEIRAVVPAVVVDPGFPSGEGARDTVRLLDGAGRLLALAREKEGRYQPYAVLSEGAGS